MIILSGARRDRLPELLSADDQRLSFAVKFYRKSDFVYEVPPKDRSTWNMFQSYFFLELSKCMMFVYMMTSSG